MKLLVAHHKPEDVGLSGERLLRIHSIVLPHMDLGDITGAVVLVARKGQVAYVDIQGTIDAETKNPMTRDSLLRMASMTKPVIGTGVSHSEFAARFGFQPATLRKAG